MSSTDQTSTYQTGPAAAPDALAQDLARAAMALARRFSAGATLWCWSPRWPEHAEHVAVEFVHPVVMGTRALPATAVATPDPIAALRSLVRAGDVLLVVAPAGDASVASALSRARAWGVETIWIGTGPAPPPGPADHVLWLGEEATAAYDGAFVLAYHVLWELTHVCFEHPGLMSARDVECGGEHCITCSDEGRIGEVVAIGPDAARVRTATGVEDVDVSLVDDVGPGDLIVLHAGVAISLVGGGEA